LGRKEEFITSADECQQQICRQLGSSVTPPLRPRVHKKTVRSKELHGFLKDQKV